MSWLSNTFGGSHTPNPAKAANDRLSQIPGQINPYYQPYIDQGRKSGESVNGQYDTLVNDPNAVYDKLGKGYKESPGYQFKLQQALNAQGNASARGGMLGTPQDQQYAMDTAHGIADQDYEAYLKHMMDLYGAGLGGQQHTTDQGYNASTNYADNIANVTGRQAQLDYEGQAGENKRHSNNWSNLFKGLGAIGGGILGAPGGPAGIIAGSSLGSNMFGGG